MDCRKHPGCAFFVWEAVRHVRHFAAKASKKYGLELPENLEESFIIVEDKANHTDAVIRVMDQCRLAGAKNIRA